MEFQFSPACGAGGHLPPLHVLIVRFQFSPACGAGENGLSLAALEGVSILARVWRGRQNPFVSVETAAFQFSPACGAGEHRFTHCTTGFSFQFSPACGAGVSPHMTAAGIASFNSRPRVARALCFSVI